MSRYADEEMSIEEERRHARRGCVFAIFLVPLCCGLILYPVQAFTPVGQRVTAHVVLFTASTGVPLPIPYARGLANVAKAACDLDETSPRPANYQTRHDNLAQEYETLIQNYDKYWRVLNRTEGHTDFYEPPEDLPGNFASAKLFYCR